MIDRHRRISPQYATLLNGTSQYWKKSNPTNVNFLKDTAFSVVLRIKTRSIVGTNPTFITNRETSVPSPGWSIQGDVSNRYLLYLINSAGGPSNFNNWNSPTNTIILNKWQLLIITYDGLVLTTSVKMYVDGVSLLVSSGSTTLTDSTSSSGDLCIGARNSVDRFTNSDYNLVQIISGYVLTQSDVDRIQATYKNGLPLSYPGGVIVANSNWNQPGRDLSGSGNHLTNIGNAPIVQIQ